MRFRVTAISEIQPPKLITIEEAWSKKYNYWEWYLYLFVYFALD